LVDELRVELGLLAEQVRGRGGRERGAHARQARLEDVAGDRVLQARQALEGLEAVLLRLQHGRERLAGGGQYGIGIESALVHDRKTPVHSWNEAHCTRFCMHCKRNISGPDRAAKVVINTLIYIIYLFIKLRIVFTSI